MARRCFKCNGTGTVYEKRPSHYGHHMFECDVCYGDGSISLFLFFMEWWAKTFVILGVCCLIYKGIHFISYDIFDLPLRFFNKEITFKSIFLWNLPIGALLSLLITLPILGEEKV